MQYVIVCIDIGYSVHDCGVAILVSDIKNDFLA